MWISVCANSNRNVIFDDLSQKMADWKLDAIQSQTDLLQHLWQVSVSVLLFAKDILSEWSIVIVQRFVGRLVILLRIMLSVGLWICYCCIDSNTFKLNFCTPWHWIWKHSSVDRFPSRVRLNSVHGRYSSLPSFPLELFYKTTLTININYHYAETSCLNLILK